MSTTSTSPTGTSAARTSATGRLRRVVSRRGSTSSAAASGAGGRARAVAALAAGMTALAIAAPAAAASSAPAASGVSAAAARPAAACATRWGTGAKGATPVALTPSPLVGVRSGRHACFDRVVVDVRGPMPAKGFRVAYVRAVTEEGSGDVVPLRGGARLQVSVGAPAYDAKGRPTYTPRNPDELVGTRGYRTLRQVAWAGSFEGQSTIGIGVRARTPMRATVLPGTSTSRLVIDVAHR